MHKKSNNPNCHQIISRKRKKRKKNFTCPILWNIQEPAPNREPDADSDHNSKSIELELHYKTDCEWVLCFDQEQGYKLEPKWRISDEHKL